MEKPNEVVTDPSELDKPLDEFLKTHTGHRIDITQAAITKLKEENEKDANRSTVS